MSIQEKFADLTTKIIVIPPRGGREVWTRSHGLLERQSGREEEVGWAAHPSGLWLKT